jgi:hypothetical protein
MTDSMLDTWRHAASSSGGRSVFNGSGGTATWLELSDLGDVLHHLDGYVAPDGHRLLSAATTG